MNSASMKSTLSWIDHDSKSRQRTLEILSLFQEKESRDELGLGGITRGLSDLLFPGTSTIQTRLRYMLIVAWVFKYNEQKHVPAKEFPGKADSLERGLIEPLLASDDRAGVYGRTSGSKLKRLPSSVYWAGLSAWGIRLTPYSLDQYMERIDEVYRIRKSANESRAESTKLGDDTDIDSSRAGASWDPGLPDIPEGFPNTLSLSLTGEEAHYLQECLLRSCGGSLLAHLVRDCTPVECKFAWDHPSRSDFTTEHRQQLTHARLFSTVFRGASLVYNIALARLRDNEDWEEEHTKAFEQWIEELPEREISEWSLQGLWDTLSDSGSTVTPRSKEFVTNWVQHVNSGPSKLLQNTDAWNLIKKRECSLKGTRSRYTNRRSLEQWGGNTGTGMQGYRWNIVSGYINDLHAGLNA